MEFCYLSYVIVVIHYSQYCIPCLQIQTIACCAGSGSSVLSGVKAELYLTGEMSHHEVLDAVSNNVNVVLCEHSNTERGYLKTLVPVFAELFSNKLEVVVSESDKDPLLVI